MLDMKVYKSTFFNEHKVYSYERTTLKHEIVNSVDKGPNPCKVF
jgi:hypothetical protein